jgi:hypothetical protein
MRLRLSDPIRKRCASEIGCLSQVRFQWSLPQAKSCLAASPAQTRQVLQNLQAVLTAVGASLDDVVKTTHLYD